MSKRLRKSSVAKYLPTDIKADGVLLTGKKEVLTYSLTNQNSICVTINKGSAKNTDFYFRSVNPNEHDLHVVIVGVVKYKLESEEYKYRMQKKVYYVDESAFDILHDKRELRKIILEKNIYPIIENIDYITDVYSHNKIMMNSMNILRKYFNIYNRDKNSLTITRPSRRPSTYFTF